MGGIPHLLKNEFCLNLADLLLFVFHETMASTETWNRKRNSGTGQQTTVTQIIKLLKCEKQGHLSLHPLSQ